MVSARDHPSALEQIANANSGALEFEEATSGESPSSSHATVSVAATEGMLPARAPSTILQALTTGGDAVILDDGACAAASLSAQVATTEGACPRHIPPALCISLVVALLHGSVFMIGRSVVRPEPHLLVGPPNVENQANLAIGLSEELIGGWTPTKIAWATMPNKCWKVGAKPGEFRNGMKLMLWDCSKSDDFILPPSGEGTIRPASSSEFCLDAPSNDNHLQFWLCSAAPAKNTRFVMPGKGQMGFIKAAAEPDRCIDVVDGISDNGRELMRWYCKQHQMNMIFLLRWPYDCTWAPWSEWSPCSTHCRTWRTRQEHNQMRTQGLTSAGNICAGTEEEVKGCTWGYCAAEGAELVT